MIRQLTLTERAYKENHGNIRVFLPFKDQIATTGNLKEKLESEDSLAFHIVQGSWERHTFSLIFLFLG
jgi:hypothetical protein